MLFVAIFFIIVIGGGISIALKRVSPMIIVVLAICAIFGVRYKDYQNQVRFDRYQIRQSSEYVRNRQATARKYEKKADKSRNHLQLLPTLMHQANSKHKIKNKRAYRREYAEYKDDYRYYHGLSKASKSSEHDYQSSLKKDKKLLKNASWK